MEVYGKKHRISPLFMDETNEEKETVDILKDASTLHEDLRNYGNLKDIDKPLIVSGILLALRESEKGSFSIDSLTGDSVETDGKKIYNAISANLVRSKISPDVKKDKILSQFAIIRDTQILNEINPKLNKTPLKHFTEFLNEKLYRSIKYTKSSEDYLGRFYGEFMSYSGGDGQTLGIVLTPKHITSLFCELLNIKSNDVILDPCTGTAGFLIAGMHKEFDEIIKEKNLKTRKEIESDEDILEIRQKHLHGFEIQPYMFTIATTNMILRGDGKSNLRNDDFMAQNPTILKKNIKATVGMMNPPYSQGSKKNPELYEINFTKQLLDSILPGGRVAVIVPISTMTGKTKYQTLKKEAILKKHTLEGVITLNPETFYNVGTHPVIAVFTAGRPHPKTKVCKFINFEDDGFKVAPHIGLIETESAIDKRQHLLDVWNDRIEADTKFCVKSTVTFKDEWLHSFFYFNDEIVSPLDFEKPIREYFVFQMNMILQRKDYLFKKQYYMDFKDSNGIIHDISVFETSFEKAKNAMIDMWNEAHPNNHVSNVLNLRGGQFEHLTYNCVDELSDCNWVEFKIGDILEVTGTTTTDPGDLIPNGTVPRITCSSVNNGLDDTYQNKATEHGSVLTVDSATIGSIYYQPTDFIATDHVEKISFYNEKEINPYVGHFLIAAINKATVGKYNYGYKFSQFRIKRQIVLLPSSDGKTPDWNYMEKYVKNVMIKKINEFLNFTA